MAAKSTTNNGALNLLKQIGLNQYESRIYTTLLASGSLSAGEIAESSNVPRSRVYDVLSSLEKKGFAIVHVGRPVKYFAVQIENAIGQVKASFDEEHKKKLDFVTKLEKDLQLALASQIEKGKKPVENIEEMIGLLRGKNNLYRHIKYLISNSNSRILKITNGLGLELLEKHCRPALEKAKKKGVKMQIIANVSDQKSIGTLHDFAQIKSHKGVEGRFLVKDGEDVVLITNPEETGIWIKSPYLAGCLEKLFEHVWEKGKIIGE